MYRSRRFITRKDARVLVDGGDVDSFKKVFWPLEHALHNEVSRLEKKPENLWRGKEDWLKDRQYSFYEHLHRNKNMDGKMKKNIEIGLKRAALLFASLLGVIGVLLGGILTGWGPLDERPILVFLFMALFPPIVGYGLFRLGIQAVMGFIPNETNGAEEKNVTSTSRKQTE